MSSELCKTPGCVLDNNGMGVQQSGLLPGCRDGHGRPEAPGSRITHPTMPPPWVPPRCQKCQEGDGACAGRQGKYGETNPNARTRRAANWAHFCQKQALAAPFWLPRRQRAGRHSSTPRTGPTLLSFRTRSHNRSEWEPAGPSPPPD